MIVSQMRNLQSPVWLACLICIVASAMSSSGCRTAGEASESCAPLAENRLVVARYAAGLARLDASRDGEHFRQVSFDEAIADLEFAARNGNLAAQSSYGRTLFGALFSAHAPRAVERDDYVSALTFLRIAARSGDQQAARFIPELAADVVITTEAPLDALPGEWVSAATRDAQAWLDCHGSPEPEDGP